jgi:hypothetical protein
LLNLYAGVNPAPSCDGAAQTLVVTGGAPPFTLSATGNACLSATVLASSGSSVTVRAGDQIGSFQVTATDALGRTATATLNQQAVNAAHIEVDAFPVVTNNGDGTCTLIVGALVTDSLGRTVPDGVPVGFRLVNPQSGISVTSPGLTNAPAPCDVGTLVITPQPGDALSCLKYVAGQAGTSVTVRAQVRTGAGAGGILQGDLLNFSLPSCP